MKIKEPVAKSFVIGPALSTEQFIAEHLFFYLVKGRLNGYYGNKTYTLRSGEYGILRKSRLGRYYDHKKNDKVEKITFVFDEPFLKTFQKKRKVAATEFQSDESLLKLENNTLIPDFIQSLLPYYDGEGKIDKAFFDVKREELLLILLQLQPELASVFFDYDKPGKINLEAFMNRNFRFNVSIKRFAYMTGRSLSAFKQVFKKIFGDTPGHWLVQKRLQEAFF